MTDLNHPCHVSFQLLPLVDHDKIYSIVDKALEMIQSSGIKHVTGPMETTMEGDYDEIMNIIRKIQVLTLEYSEELVSVIKVHLRKGGPVTFEEKGVN